jgi:hypothetical protein
LESLLSSSELKGTKALMRRPFNGWTGLVVHRRRRRRERDRSSLRVCSRRRLASPVVQQDAKIGKYRALWWSKSAKTFNWAEEAGRTRRAMT